MKFFTHQPMEVIMTKTKGFLLAAGISLAIVFIGCASNPQPQQMAAQSQDSGSPFGEVYEAHCTAHDDDDWFVAVGIASGPRTQMGVLQENALTNAQNVVRRKMQHVYEGMVSSYSNTIGNNQGNDVDNSIKSAGDQIIDQIVNNTNAVCGPKFSAPDSKGHVNAFTGIRISKKNAADKIADKVENVVSKDERLRIEFERKNFREEMAEKFKAYKESQSR